jgi:hypothetical protein
MKPIIMQFSPSSGHFLPLNPNFLLIVLRIFSSCNVAADTKKKSKIIFLYISIVVFLNIEMEGILN